MVWTETYLFDQRIHINTKLFNQKKDKIWFLSFERMDDIMRHETQISFIKNIKQYLPFPSKNPAELKSSNQSLFSTCVTKIPRHSTQSHTLHKKSVSFSLCF